MITGAALAAVFASLWAGPALWVRHRHRRAHSSRTAPRQWPRRRGSPRSSIPRRRPGCAERGYADEDRAAHAVLAADRLTRRNVLGTPGNPSRRVADLRLAGRRRAPRSPVGHRQETRAPVAGYQGIEHILGRILRGWPAPSTTSREGCRDSISFAMTVPSGASGRRVTGGSPRAIRSATRRAPSLSRRSTGTSPATWPDSSSTATKQIPLLYRPACRARSAPAPPSGRDVRTPARGS